MKTISLTRNKFAFVDDEDYAWLSTFKWRAITRGGRWYAVRGAGSAMKPLIWMHRVILQPPLELDVDHRDGDGLNNTRKNIRVATKSQNCQNRPKWGKAEFKGVVRDGNRWKARVQIKGNRKYLGCFTTAEKAALAYDEEARKQHGEFSRLNFPS